MRLTLLRKNRKGNAITGEIWVDGALNCYSLENQTLAIVAGTFDVTVYDSPTKGRVPLVNGVPGRTYIEIHVANFPNQLLGCIAPGSRVSADLESVEASGDAFKPLLSLIESVVARGEKVTLEVVEIPSTPVPPVTCIQPTQSATRPGNALSLIVAFVQKLLPRLTQ